MKSNREGLRSRKWFVVLLVLSAFFAFFALSASRALDDDDDGKQKADKFTKDFRLQDCTFLTEGTSPYFVLEPGYQLVFEGEEDGETLRLEITVLDETETIDLPEVGAIETRVVEEVETADGEPVETSRNFFAICDKTNDVFYFGEEVDIFEPDGTVTHEGAWRAGEADEDGLAEPGIIMPGTFLLGSRYYQELADGIALDRAEHVEMGMEVTTEAGEFSECVKVVETTPLEPGKAEKIYCPEVGLVSDPPVELIDYGFNIIQ
jgi:hypothetical protein